MPRDFAQEYTWTVWQEAVGRGRLRTTVLEVAGLARLPMPPTRWGRGGGGGGVSFRIRHPCPAEVVQSRAAGLVDAAVARHRVQQPSDLAEDDDCFVVVVGQHDVEAS